MPQFTVTLVREVSQTATLRVDADDKELAEQQAIERCKAGDVNWWDCTAGSEACVLNVEEATAG